MESECSERDGECSEMAGSAQRGMGNECSERGGECSAHMHARKREEHETLGWQ